MIIPYYCEDYPEDPPEPSFPTGKKEDKEGEYENKKEKQSPEKARKTSTVPSDPIKTEEKSAC